ncbi:MAG: hypothetical protein K2M40_06285, partial [Muribaculaceae bacterium]|nr:hypothetical protein [Muribaculaceae bacterium]
FISGSGRVRCSLCRGFGR